MNTINTNQSAYEGQIYKNSQTNIFYIGLSSGILKTIGDLSTISSNSTLTGDGTATNPLGLAQLGATYGQALVWNGTSWAPGSASGTTTVSNSFSGVQLTTTVNGVPSMPVSLPLATSTAVGFISLACDLSGTAWCPRVADNAITSAKIQNSTIINEDLSSSSVSSDNIIDGTIITQDIANSQITFAKMQNISGLRLLGNSNSFLGPISEIQLGSGLSFSGNVLNTTQNTTTVSNSFNAIQLTTTVNGVSASPVSLPLTTTSNLGVIQLTGDLAGSASWPVIGNGRITYPKIQDVNPQRILGNPTGTAASPSEISLGTGLSFSGTVLNATNNGTVTTVTGTSPIVINGTPTSTPNVTITRNSIVTGASSSSASNPLVLDVGATNAVVGGSNATLTVNNTAALWNANQLRSTNISTIPPTTGQVLRYDGTNWAPYTITSSGNKKLVISAEYAGAVIVTGSGTNHTGDMTGGNTGTTSPIYMNYYEWKGRASGSQTYQVIVRITLPNDFTSWQSTNPFQFYNMSNTGCNVTLAAYTTSTTAFYTLSAISNSGWTATSLTTANLSSWATAGSTASFVFTFSSTNTNVSRIGDIILNYQ